MVRQTFTLILLLASMQAGQEYYIYYRVVSSNLTVVEESLKISPAMTPLSGRTAPLCKFETEEKSFEKWARKNRQKLLECILKESVKIRSFNRFDSHLPTKSLDILTSEILPVKVEFNDGLVTIKKIQQTSGSHK